MKRRRTLLPILFFAGAVATARGASAEPTASERTLARTLFEDGKKLVKEGNLEAACPKLEESQRLDPGMGTLFNLADCWERAGRTASAWSAYLEVADDAKRAGQPDRERAARARAAAIEAKVPHVVIVAKDAEGVTVRIDGTPVKGGALDTPLPIDPGGHAIEAIAPGKRPFATRVEITTGTMTVEIAPLEADAASPPPPPPQPAAPATEPPPHGTWHRPAALAAGGVGVVALGIGTYFGLHAASQWSDGNPHCTGTVCDDTGRAAYDDASSSARVADVALAIGIVAIAAGVVLWVIAPSRDLHLGIARNGVLASGTLP